MSGSLMYDILGSSQNNLILCANGKASVVLSLKVPKCSEYMYLTSLTKPL